MSDMPIGRKALYVSVRFVLHVALGLFLTCSLEFSLSTMLSFKCAVDFLVIITNSSKSRRVTVQMSSKSASRNLAVILLKYRSQRNPLRESIDIRD